MCDKMKNPPLFNNSEDVFISDGNISISYKISEAMAVSNESISSAMDLFALAESFLFLLTASLQELTNSSPQLSFVTKHLVVAGTFLFALEFNESTFISLSSLFIIGKLLSLQFRLHSSRECSSKSVNVTNGSTTTSTFTSAMSICEEIRCLFPKSANNARPDTPVPHPSSIIFLLRKHNSYKSRNEECLLVAKFKEEEAAVCRSSALVLFPSGRKVHSFNRTTNSIKSKAPIQTKLPVES
mmetsp:Transcript_15944/g.16121  ORF Transcript_15944/g.16121 Transcript_15944/m.16121 type:complete len:241 (-) Transcript_15944:16-738(-)